MQYALPRAGKASRTSEHDMWNILAGADSPALSTRRAGQLPRSLRPSSGSQEAMDKWRSRSLPPAAYDRTKQQMGPQHEPGDGSTGDGLVPQRQWRGCTPTDMIYKHVLRLEERLERGAREVQDLRVREEATAREAQASKSHIMHLQERMHELQLAVAAREQDSGSLGTLRQALQAFQHTAASEIAAADAKGQLIASEGRSAISLMHSAVQQLQSALSAEKAASEQARRCPCVLCCPCVLRSR
jgi:hypothetical protein